MLLRLEADQHLDGRLFGLLDVYDGGRSRLLDLDRCSLHVSHTHDR